MPADIQEDTLVTRYERMTKPELIRHLILSHAELHEARLNINHWKNEAARYHDLWTQALAPITQPPRSES